MDALGNDVHHFDILASASTSSFRDADAGSNVAAPALPERLEPSAWDALARLRADGQLWDFFEPSPRVPSRRLFARSPRPWTRARAPTR